MKNVQEAVLEEAPDLPEEEAQELPEEDEEALDCETEGGVTPETVTTLQGATYLPKIREEDHVAFYEVEQPGTKKASKWPLCSWLRVAGTYENETNDSQGRVIQLADKYGTWLLNEDGSEKLVVVSREDLTDNSHLKKTLAGAGLIDYAHMNWNSGGHLGQLIEEYPLEGLPCYQSVNYVGWVEWGRCFVYPSGRVQGKMSNGRPIIYSGPFRQRERDAQKGSLDDWKEIAAIGSRSSRIVLAIGAAFTGPFIQRKGGSSQGINLMGPSSTGKTTAQRACASVWGSAKPGAGRLFKCGGTMNGLEAAFQLGNSAVIVFDEFASLGTKGFSSFGQAIIYMGGNGGNAIRMNVNGGLRDQHGWFTVFLISAERTLASYLKEAKVALDPGAERRCPNLDACPEGGLGVFEPGAFNNLEESAAASDRITTLAEEQAFGTAGPAFIEKMIEYPGGPDALWSHWCDLQRRVQLSLPVIPRNDPNGQQFGVSLKFFAGIGASLLLALEWGILPKPGELSEDGYTEELILRYMKECAESAQKSFNGSTGEAKQLASALLNLPKTHKDNFNFRHCDARKNLIGNPKIGDALRTPLFGYVGIEEGKHDGEELKLRCLYLIDSPELRRSLDIGGRRLTEALKTLPKEADLGDKDKTHPFRRRVPKGATSNGLPEGNYFALDLEALAEFVG